MTLDLGALGRQMNNLGAYLRQRRPATEGQIALALGVARERAMDFEWLAAEAVARDDLPFRPARPLERLDQRVRSARRLPSYTVVATDGSQVEPDQHAAVLCYVLNVGWALLEYGSVAHARLGTTSSLKYTDDDLYLQANGGRQVPVEGNLLSIVRHLAETDRLASLAAEAPPGQPTVGLQDGTLLLSASGRGEETYVWGRLLERFLGALTRLREANTPVAAYVSRPRSTDFVSLLRLALCPREPGECQRCLGAGNAPCAALFGLPDRAVFGALPLGPGERSGLFMSPWTTSLQHYGDHRIHFFYANTGSEVVRVEVPEWVACDQGAVGAVHAVLDDQCARGQGYPRALIEAHEKAVITAADRRTLGALLDRSLVESGLPSAPSAKLQSKRIRSL